MSQLDTQPGAELQDRQPPVADSQAVGGQPDGQGVAAGQPAGQPADDLGARIPYHTYPKHAGKDISRVFHESVEYAASEQEGFAEIRRQAKARGISPGQLMQYMEQGLQPPARGAAEPPQRAAGGQRYNQFGQPDPRGTFDANMQPVALDANDDPVLRELSSLKQQMAEEKKAREDYFTQQKTERQQQAATEAFQRGEAAIDKAITEVLGIKANPTKRNWLGRPDVEVDRARRMAKLDIYDAVFDARRAAGNYSPDPVTAQEIAFVADELKGDYNQTVSDLEAAGRVADRRNHLPKGAVPRGGGGGPSRQAKTPTTAEEFRQSMKDDIAAGRV